MCMELKIYLGYKKQKWLEVTGLQDLAPMWTSAPTKTTMLISPYGNNRFKLLIKDT